MKIFSAYTIATVLFLGSVFSCSKQQESKLDYVDPSIGGVGVILQPTRPTVHLPNSMVRVFPMRKDHLDDQIGYFPLTNASHRLNSVFSLMPVTGEVNDAIWNRRFSYDLEKLTPYYYSTLFDESGDSIEFAPQARSGYFRVHFVNNQPHYFRMGVLNGNGEITVNENGMLSGSEEFAGMKAYFYAETDSDITEIHYQNSEKRQHVLIGMGNEAKTASFRYGISYISIEQAKQNMLNEIPGWDFEAVKSNARAVWEEALSKIDVTGGNESQKRVFYTALYRSYERMVDINEYGRYYSAYDHQVHESGEPFYVDNWIWDNYIALEPLHMVINPKMATERIRSYVKMYQQGGTMPSFALVFGDWPAMTGNFAACWMADAWFKGLRDFDLESAYEGLKKNSLEATLIPWRNGPRTVLDNFYNEHGYMPGLHPGEEETVEEVSLPWERRQAVSVTIENSYSDWCIAQLADELNLDEESSLFLSRSGNYKNVFRTEKGIVWPKDKEGAWIEPYNPSLADRIYFTENNAFTYNWSAKHDLHGLFSLMDETAGAEQTLDQLFREELGTFKFKFWYRQPDASGLVGQFVMGNEPSFHIPYIYNYLGAPWKTQKRIRMLLETFYTDNLHGIPGDEDGGGMSSFVVFSMMGFFQVTPGIPVYSIGSPVFDKISIKLPGNKEFTIIARNNSEINKYIQKASLNGVDLERAWFTHDELINEGTLELVMGSKPNKLWGSNKEELPPSSIDYSPGSKN
ncbi:MAG: GH92 family glycosyl hydrolase [Bacteroidota bacterium]